MVHLTVVDWAAIVQAAGTIFIALTVVVYWHQLSAMRKQLDDNRRTNQTSQYQAALQLMFDWRSDLIENPKLAEGFTDASFYASVFQSVPVDQYFHTMKLFHIYQHYWLLNDLGVIDRRIWNGWSKNIAINMQIGRHRMVWDKLKQEGFFDSQFVAFIDGCIPARNQL